MRFAEGHTPIMKQAYRDLERSGYQLPEAVESDWLILGNIRRDVPMINLDRNVSWRFILWMIVNGTLCFDPYHPEHAMRCRTLSVTDAYQQMMAIIREGFALGLNQDLDWQQRSLAFGAMLHTLQDSYCIAHCSRLDNTDVFSAIIDMHTYPSRQHPISTKKDDVWQDKEQTAFKPYAASAIQATVAALKIFCKQDSSQVDRFMEQYLSYRPDVNGYQPLPSA